jgi:hypothetical protein
LVFSEVPLQVIKNEQLKNLRFRIEEQEKNCRKESKEENHIWIHNVINTWVVKLKATITTQITQALKKNNKLDINQS